jgi:hypothetical protein
VPSVLIGWPCLHRQHSGVVWGNFFLELGFSPCVRKVLEQLQYGHSSIQCEVSAAATGTAWSEYTCIHLNAKCEMS